MTKEKRFFIYNYVVFAASFLFSFISISFHLDISLLAFPVSIIMTGTMVYFGYFKFLKPKDARKTIVYYKLIQYLPFVMLFSFIVRRAGKTGTSYAYDVISVILWCIIFIASLLVSYYMNPKRIKKLLTGFKSQIEKKKTFSIKRKVIFEAIDWIDALIQAVCMVLLIQIFIVQLYVIPSESMVPSYLIGDRVAVTKINCGPKFPLTDVGLPDFTKYKRGDVVVLRNPHYRIDRKSEVKSVVSQLVYMLTIMTVNLNTDENGNMKYDPLVKRIAGVPGEQLVMQDGVLYARTKASDDFVPVEIDNKYACWNLYDAPAKVKPGIRDFRMAPSDYQTMLDFEESRRNFDLNAAAFSAKEIVKNVKKYAAKDRSASFNYPSRKIDYVFNNAVNIADDIAYSDEGLKWFEEFVTSWIEEKDVPKDIYSEANFKMDVMGKMLFARLVERYSMLLASGNTYSDLISDAGSYEILQDANVLIWYVKYLLDERNMPVFPANDEKNDSPNYIPENCYFMMGDNRFNSQDLRHSFNQFEAKLSDYDDNTFTYDSFMAPQYINKKLIQGKTAYRIWPLNRLGSLAGK